MTRKMAERFKANDIDKVLSSLMKVIEIVNEQAKDPGLWFEALTASEWYLQNELRRLHSAIEKEGGGE